MRVAKMATIRLATVSDAKTVADIYGREVSTSAISFEIEPPSESEMKVRMASVLSFAPWLVYENHGEILGFVYASKHRDRAAYLWSVDVAVYIYQNSRRQGVARALYTSLFEALRLQGFYAAHAGIALPNPGSVGLHESLGFRKIGVYPAVGFKLGSWHDVGWWQLPLMERRGVPQPPKSMLEVQADPRWETILSAGLMGAE